mmetsp:Transcript_10445/g.36705  ORF Transcript_10445/g.36705 Transcript_10445/m.36705 type:complete len:232 (+) Transcript_10445:772-1467(+)
MVRPEHVSVNIARRGRIDITVEPAEDQPSIAIKDRLTDAGVAPIIGMQISGVPGIAEVRLGEGTLTTSAILKESITGWRIEKVGGLYLDYTNKMYYDGMYLMFMTILVLIAGGYSVAGETAKHKNHLWITFVAVSLVILSWLHAPFIFNPYQFSVGYLVDDVKAWYGFSLPVAVRIGSRGMRRRCSSRRKVLRRPFSMSNCGSSSSLRLLGSRSCTTDCAHSGSSTPKTLG